MAMARNIRGWLSSALSGRDGLDGTGDDQAARRPAEEVFPGLGFSLVVGLILGAVMGIGLAWLHDSRGQSVAGYSGGCALAGAILGAFLGLSRAVWRPGVPTAMLEPEPAP